MAKQAVVLDATEMHELVDREVRPHHKKRKTAVVLKRSMQKLVEMRWDATRADENSIRQRYREQLTVEEALAELAQLRKLCEIGAYEFNQRVDHVNQNCASCGRLMDARVRPAMIEPVRDAKSGTLSNNFYCSIICVQRRNLKKLGREELIK